MGYDELNLEIAFPKHGGGERAVHAAEPMQSGTRNIRFEPEELAGVFWNGTRLPASGGVGKRRSAKSERRGIQTASNRTIASSIERSKEP